MPAESKGNGLIDIDEAGKLLGCGSWNVRHLVKRGMLRPHYSRGRALNSPMFFHKEEVAALAEARAQDSFDVQRIAAQATQAFAMARQLERRLRLLETLLGRVGWPLPLDEESVVARYARAQDEQLNPTSTVDGVMEWARVFMTMGEEYLDATEAFTGDEDCWKVFCDLADILVIETPFDRTNFDRELEAAYGYLDVGRKNVRVMAFFYLRNRHGSHIANKLFDVEDAHREIISLATSLVG